jgi:hypothetical protein
MQKDDYIQILNYYKVPIPKSIRLIQKEAEKLLSSKLCKCIKKVNSETDSKNESRAIGICTKTIFNRRGNVILILIKQKKRENKNYFA